jgi:cell division septal protein FtsQ
MAARSTRKVNRRARAAGPRDHLLDVRIRTSTARRRQQEKIGRWIWNLLILGVFGVSAVFGVRYALDRFFFQNAEYTLTRITTNLDDVMSREEALAEIGVQEGVNIFSIDLAKIEERLRAIPQVETARVTRELPDHLQVSVTSRQPVAWVAPDSETADPTASEKSLLVDAQGFLMRPRHVKPQVFHLPVILGLKDDNLRDGERLQSEDLTAALALLETVGRHPESLLKIRTLDISRGYRIDVVNDTNTRIIFAARDYDDQLARLQQLLVHCSETGRTMESVNLMVKRNTPVTFVLAAAPVVEEPPVPAATPAPPPKKSRRN